jgi:RNA polymerase sigma-70 factor (ECF subfamily)
MTSDEALILELRGGSQEAFTELFLRYRQRVYGFFRRRMSDAAQAEELAQETFMAVLRGAQRYEPRATFRAYLFGIAFNILSAHRRKAMNEAARRNGASGSAAGSGEEDFGGVNLARTATDGMATNFDAETAIWVRQAVGKLAESEREILMLREFEELSYEEIAKVVKAPVNTVRSRLFRARMALREILESGAKRVTEGSTGDLSAGSAGTGNSEVRK